MEKIIKILDSHSVPYYIESGRIYADSMESGTKIFEILVDVTEYSHKQLYEWLGY